MAALGYLLLLIRHAYLYFADAQSGLR